MPRDMGKKVVPCARHKTHLRPHQTIEASFGLDTTIFMQSTEALTLTPAVYNGTYTITSDDETAASPLFGNNTRTREFEITAASTNPGSIYAQDGIDVYANPILS